MYKAIIRPLLFLISPERVHAFVVHTLRILFKIPGVSPLAKKIYCINDPRLERELFGLKFANPVGIAAGFDKEAAIYNELAHFGFGHVEVGTVTPKGQPGNPRPRLFRLPKDKALINRMGFNNHGVEAFLQNIKQNRPNIPIGGNIGKNTDTPNDQAIGDYCHCFEILFDYVDYFTVNVSCPNITGLSSLQNNEELTALLSAISKINNEKPIRKPVLLKISPDLTDAQLDEVIQIVQKTGLDGIIATNTSSLRDGIRLSNPTEIEQIGKGGLSGLPLQDKSTRTIAYIFEKTKGKIPIIAVGGIFTAHDALEKIRAGASLVQVYTGFVYEGPSIAKTINRAILREAKDSLAKVNTSVIDDL